MKVVKAKLVHADYKRLDSTTASAIVQEALKSTFAKKKPTKRELVQWFAKSAWAKTYKPYQFAAAIKAMLRREEIARQGSKLSIKAKLVSAATK